MAQSPEPRDPAPTDMALATDTRTQAMTRTASATRTQPVASLFMVPPQGPGAPRRLRVDGSPRGEVRLNTAMKALLDPVTRMSPSRVYSGQARNWNR
jgi:hypothetical protein